MRWPMSAATAAITTAGPSGLPHWSYAHVLPYFRRQESWEGGAGAYRGGDGPLTTRRSRYPGPARRGLRSGRRARPDIPRPTITTAPSRKASAARRRRSATAGAAAPRSPICGRRWRGPISRSRPARWSRGILFEGTRAIGVEYLQRRRNADRACRARGDPGRRRHQLAAAADAVGDRRPRRHCARTASRRACRCAASAATCRTTSRSRSCCAARSPVRCTARCGSTASRSSLAKALFARPRHCREPAAAA